MEDVEPSGSPPVATGDDAGDGSKAPAAAPITNAILSQAVTSAISQLDTKRAFDMMLLNEQMTAMEAENKCLKEETTFLKESLAKQAQEASEMYHYFHGKMDSHVATIDGLERDLADARATIEQLKEEHETAMVNAQNSSEILLSKSNAEAERLREELAQLHVFSAQKKEMETLVSDLQAQIEANVARFAAEKNALELKAMFEKDRLKKEMLTHMKETKEALLLRTDDQLNTTTKRTMMENDHFMEELSFQSKETEKLLMRFRNVEEEVQRLRVKNKVLEENETVMAKKNHYYQKILSQLKKQNGDLPKQAPMTGGDEEQEAAIQNMKAELLAKRDEIERLNSRVASLEDNLRHAQQWIAAFQQEKQFVVAQQDEIIQFLCRSLSEATQSPRVHRFDDDTSRQTIAKTTTTMAEMATMLSPVALDELSSDDTRGVMAFLLEKMRVYQQQVAAVYRGTGSPSSPLKGHGRETTTRELLTKQLGVELPPIAPPSQLTGVTSPLKVKRRIQPYAAMPMPASRPLPVNQRGSSMGEASLAAPNSLLLMATSHFNFIQSTPSPVKSPTSYSRDKKPSDASSPGRQPSVKKLDGHRSGHSTTEREDESQPSLMSDALPSAWSTDSLPKYEPGKEAAESSDQPPRKPPVAAERSSASRRRS